jgi:hypothetical protein
VALPLGKLLEDYFIDATRALCLLYKEGLAGHFLVVAYSTIDTVGLLNAPLAQLSASSSSFKEWCRRYILVGDRFGFSAEELWAARCAVLHTFTSRSDLSRSGKVRELQYICGPKESEQIAVFMRVTSKIQGGRHVPVHLDDFCEALIRGLEAFVGDLEAACTTEPGYEERLRHVLIAHPM